MLSENFKKRIDKTTDLGALRDEIATMRRILLETDSPDTKDEMSEKIGYVQERVRAIKRQFSVNRRM